MLPLLRDKYVLLQLYVDDRTELPKAEQRFSKSLGKPLKMVGDKWAEFEIARYQANYQPCYVLLNPKTEQVLVPTSGPAVWDAAALATLLHKGLAAMPK